MNHDLLNLKALKIPYMKSTTFGDYTIKIEHDNTQESSREWDNLGTMVCFHSRYNLSDNEHGYETPDVFIHVLSGLYSEIPTEDLTEDQHKRCNKIAREKNVILPLYLYDHSGLMLSTTAFSCKWDSGMVGWIYVSYKNIRKEYSVKRISKKLRKKVVSYLENEVDTYNSYLCGEVYYFNVTKGEDLEKIDSCGGFFGYEDSYMIDIIKGQIEADIKNTPQQTEMNIQI